jgi:hypothetical protein
LAEAHHQLVLDLQESIQDVWEKSEDIRTMLEEFMDGSEDFE